MNPKILEAQKLEAEARRLRDEVHKEESTRTLLLNKGLGIRIPSFVESDGAYRVSLTTYWQRMIIAVEKIQICATPVLALGPAQIDVLIPQLSQAREIWIEAGL